MLTAVPMGKEWADGPGLTKTDKIFPLLGIDSVSFEPAAYTSKDSKDKRATKTRSWWRRSDMTVIVEEVLIDAFHADHQTRGNQLPFPIAINGAFFNNCTLGREENGGERVKVALGLL